MSTVFRNKQGGDGDDSLRSESIPLTYKTPNASSQVIAPPEYGKPPPETKSLQRSWLYLSFDFILALLPPVFIGVMIAAASQNKKPQSAKGDEIENALLLGPTIFPIVFAAICGKALKSIALYRSQDGMSLRLLEHLSGSSSLFSALERAFLLRSFGAVGLITTFVWLLSPLGGQALSPRLLSKQHFYLNSTQNATYLSSDFLNTTDLDSASGAASVLSRVTTVYLSSLSSSADVRGSPRDVWGNPKTSIPDWSDGKVDASGWKPLANTNDTAGYTNLIGLPVKAFGHNTTSEFAVSSMNMEVRCSSLEYTDTETFKKNLKEPLVPNYGGGGTWPNGTTNIVFQQAIPNNGYATTFLYVTNTSWTRFVTDTTKPLDIFFGSRTWEKESNTVPNGSLPISLATCTMVPLNLETKLSCAGQSCRPIAARRQPAAFPPASAWAVMAIFKRGHFCEMGSSRHPNEAGEMEHFIQSGAVGDVQYDLLNLYDMPLADFEQRFQQVLNTFWYAAGSQIFSSGNFSSTANKAFAVQTPAEVTEDLGLHYVCHWTWFGLAFAVVILLEGLAIANVVLRFRTRTPDIFGYVSSLTIGNRYCEGRGLEQSSALDGLERARALGGVRFQLADVRGGEDLGRIAFVPMEDQGKARLSRVKFDRHYD